MTKTHVEIIGIAGNDPQRIGIGKTAPVKLSLATTERWKDSAGNPQERTDWHSVFFLDHLAERALTHIPRGSPVLVSGTLTSRQYESKDGELHTDGGQLVFSIGTSRMSSGSGGGAVSRFGE